MQHEGAVIRPSDFFLCRIRRIMATRPVGSGTVFAILVVPVIYQLFHIAVVQIGELP